MLTLGGGEAPSRGEGRALSDLSVERGGIQSTFGTRPAGGALKRYSEICDTALGKPCAVSSLRKAAPPEGRSMGWPVLRAKSSEASGGSALHPMRGWSRDGPNSCGSLMSRRIKTSTLA